MEPGAHWHMISRPRLPRLHPDRGIECEMVAGDALNELHDQIVAAGWTCDEAATALLRLAMQNVEARRAMAEDEVAIMLARKARAN